MRFTTLPDTLFVNGVDLAGLPGVIVSAFDGVHSPATRRGDNDIIPGRDGQLGTAKPLDAYTFSVALTILPIDVDGDMPSTGAGRRALMLANLRTLAAVVLGSDGQVTLTRRHTTATGSIDVTAAGELVDGLTPDMLNVETGQLQLSFINLDGCWHAVGYATVNPGTVAVQGDLPTRRIMLDLPSAGTLANVTLGVTVHTMAASMLDVAGYDASGALATLTHAGDRSWFVLRPGDNTLTWSGTGTPDVLYRAAYL